MTVSVMEEDTLRKTYLLDRGQYDKPIGDALLPSAIPAVMKFDDKKYERNRVGLAKWTTDKLKPLTARVFVSQMWQEFFGRGIVKTSGDFGMQGELPTHPELLDWLAVDPWKPVNRALITHAHFDHARTGHKQYLATIDSVPILKHRLGSFIKIQGLRYEESITINQVEITFHPAGHIIGSAQIRLAYKVKFG